MSTGPTAPQPVPAAFTALVDDAAIFPPGDEPLPEAVAAHREHRAAPYSGLLGPFVVSDTRLPDLVELVSTSSTDAPLPVAVVVQGGAGAIEGAVRWATRSGDLELRALEIALRGDPSELSHNARRVVTAVDQLVATGLLDDEAHVYVEPPRLHGEQPGHGWLSALDEIAAMGHRVKLRTGGTDPDAFPGGDELVRSIGAALDRELAFKCTAGLHHAVRHRDPATGSEHHGFLNVLVTTARCALGGDVASLTEILEQQEPAVLLEQVAALDADGDLVRARRWFTSFGSCSVHDPVQDLIRLHLVPDLLELP